jgi:hypothetical protein
VAPGEARASSFGKLGSWLGGASESRGRRPEASARPKAPAYSGIAVPAAPTQPSADLFFHRPALLRAVSACLKDSPCKTPNPRQNSSFTLLLSAPSVAPQLNLSPGNPQGRAEWLNLSPWQWSPESFTLPAL